MRARQAVAAFVLGVSTVGTAACARGRAPAVPVIAGSADELSALVGKWSGEYSSATTGRRGSIVFTLAAGRDTAVGDVVMMPSGASGPLRRASGNAVYAAGAEGAPGGVIAPRASSALTIRFVRLAGDSVVGMLEPYEGPDCACVLTTRFVGRVRGDRITGTFETRGSPTYQPQVGHWQVKRKSGKR